MMLMILFYFFLILVCIVMFRSEMSISFIVFINDCLIILG